MRYRERMNTKIINIILAFIASLALCLDYKAVYLMDFTAGKIFNMDIITVAVMAVILAAFYLKIEIKEMHILKKILSALFSIFMVLGNSFAKVDSLEMVFGSKIMIAVSVIAFIGFYSLFIRGFVVLDQCIGRYIDRYHEEEIASKGKLAEIFYLLNKRPFLSSMIIILICWCIYAFAFYPIILSPDPSFQIRQFFNVHTKYADWVIQLDPSVNITNHHPVLHTLLLGGCLSLGRKLVNDNFGLFIYSALQSVILASVLSYTIAYLKKIGVSSKKRAIILLIYALVPAFPFYAMSGVKDTFYAAFVILYTIIIFNFVRYKKDEKLRNGQALRIYLVLMLIALFRNNGLYVVLLSFPLLIIYSKKNRLRTIVIFMAFISSFMCYSKVILPYYKITDGSAREALSIPFQQTARYVRDHEDDLTEDDKEAIDKVLGYSDLAERYNPELSDPVKNKFNKYATSEDLKAYFSVWLKGLKKHPVTYIEATMNNVYGYFYPNRTNWYIYSRFDSRITKNNLVDYHYNKLEGLRIVLEGFGNVFPYIPIIGLISNIGANTWAILVMGAYLIIKKKKQYLMVLMPAYITLLICIASPANTYFRYTMPYIFAMPTLIAMFINVINKHS